MSYAKGTLIHISAEFEAYVEGTLQYVDPTAVFCKYKTPGQPTTTLVYGTDAALVKSAVGKYYVDIDAQIPGRWYYKFYSTGTYQGAKEGSFDIDEDNV